jgi:hypothetical protein
MVDKSICIGGGPADAIYREERVRMLADYDTGNWGVSFASLLQSAGAAKEVLLRHRPASFGALPQ